MEKNIQKASLLSFQSFSLCALFFGAGIFCASIGIDKPFAQFPASMGAYIALISAFILVKGTLSDKFDWMLKSIAQNNVFIPVVVLALAGGFSAVTKGIGGVDAIVALCLKYVPHLCCHCGLLRGRQYHLPGQRQLRHHGGGHRSCCVDFRLLRRHFAAPDARYHYGVRDVRQQLQPRF